MNTLHERHGMPSHLRGVLALVCVMALGAPLQLLAGDIEVAPPSPIATGQEKPPLDIKLPSPEELKAPKEEEETEGGGEEEKPKRAWKRLTPDQVITHDFMLYASTPSITRAKEAFKRSALAGLLGEEEMEDTLKSTLEGLRDGYVLGDGTSPEYEVRRRGHEIDLLLKMFDAMEGHVALAVGMPPELKPGKTGSPPFLLVMTIPWGDVERQEALQAMMEQFSSVQLIDPRYKDTLSKVGEYDILGLSCKDLDLDESWAFVENLFIYGQGKGVVEKAIKAYHEARGVGTIAQHEGYNRAFSKVGEDAQAYVQFSLGALGKRLAKENPKIAEMIKDELKVLSDENSPQWALGISVTSGELASVKERFLARGHRTDKYKPEGVCRNASAYLCGRDTLVFAAYQMDFRKIFEGVNELAKIKGAAEAVPLTNAINQLMQLIGVADNEGLAKALAPFRGEMAVMMNYVPGANILSNFSKVMPVMFALEVNGADRAKAEKTLEDIRRTTQLKWGEFPYQGFMIHYQLGAKRDERRKHRTRPLFGSMIPTQTEGGAQPPAGKPFFVAYSFVDVTTTQASDKPRTFLILSDNLKAIQKAIQQSKFPQKSLAASQGFKGLMSEFNEARFGVNYIDLALATRAFYRDVLPSILPLMSANPYAKQEFLDRLPKESSLERYMSGLAWASTWLNEGSLIESLSPTGNLPLVGIIGAMSWSWYKQAQQQRMSERVTAKMKEISLGLHLYASDFDRFPERLSDLFPDYVSDKEIFSSPYSPKAVSAKEDIDEQEKTNLIYVPGRDLHDLSKSVLVYEVQPTRATQTDRGFRTLHHTLQLNGRVVAYPKSRLDRVLEGKADFSTGEFDAVETPGGAGGAGTGQGAGGGRGGRPPRGAPTGRRDPTKGMWMPGRAGIGK